MKWNIYYNLKGSNGQIDSIPHIGNPIEANNLREVLRELTDISSSLFLGSEVVGLRIEPILDMKTSIYEAELAEFKLYKETHTKIAAAWDRYLNEDDYYSDDLHQVISECIILPGDSNERRT
jgi:hypothetical protein